MLCIGLRNSYVTERANVIVEIVTHAQGQPPKTQIFNYYPTSLVADSRHRSVILAVLGTVYARPDAQVSETHVAYVTVSQIIRA